MNKEMLHVQVIRQNITQIYLLAAILSATGEKNPTWLASEYAGAVECAGYSPGRKIHKVYWPSSIAVSGPTSQDRTALSERSSSPARCMASSKYAGEFLVYIF